MTRDQLYRAPREQIEPFRFDAAVAAVFDDMIRRSIPGYDVLLQMIGLAARSYARPGSTVYDLGCSLGAATLAVLGAAPKVARVCAVDQSAEMVERCRELLRDQVGQARVLVECADVRQYPLEPASLVVLNFTLQFVPAPDRLAVLQKVQRALQPEGVLVLSEKLALTPDEAAVLEPLHDAFRRENGYTELEISQKRSALENVLACDGIAAHEQRLYRAGFRHVVCWFRVANFASWLAFV